MPSFLEASLMRDNEAGMSVAKNIFGPNLDRTILRQALVRHGLPADSPAPGENFYKELKDQLDAEPDADKRLKIKQEWLNGQTNEVPTTEKKQ